MKEWEDSIEHNEADDDRPIDPVGMMLKAIEIEECLELIIQKCYGNGITSEVASEVLEYISNREDLANLIKALEYAKCNVQFI